MKRRMILSLALTLSVLLSLMSFPLTAQGQTRLRSVGDTGPIKLGPNQVLRLEVCRPTDTDWFFRFRRTEYMQSSCNDGACKNSPISQIASPMIMMAAGETARIDIPNTGSPVRVMVLSNKPDVQVDAMVVDGVTGNIVSILWRHDNGTSN